MLPNYPWKGHCKERQAIHSSWTPRLWGKIEQIDRLPFPQLWPFCLFWGQIQRHGMQCISREFGFKLCVRVFLMSLVTRWIGADWKGLLQWFMAFMIANKHGHENYLLTLLNTSFKSNTLFNLYSLCHTLQRPCPRHFHWINMSTSFKRGPLNALGCSRRSQFKASTFIIYLHVNKP